MAWGFKSLQAHQLYFIGLVKLKILCIGNQTHDTDDRTTKLARENNSINHGLITDENIVIDSDGYWHTSLADVEYSVMLQLARRFDSVYFFDQDDKSNKTLKLYQELESLASVELETVSMFDNLLDRQHYWHQQFKINSSMCIKPFIAPINKNNKSEICDVSSYPITQQEHEIIKQNMIEGVKNSHCENCYAEEGMPVGFQSRKPKWGEFNSTRISESLDWIGLLDLHNVNDLFTIDKPYYYRVASDNLNSIDNIRLADPVTRVDIVGDCTAEFYEFLKTCVQHKITNFGLSFSSNTLDMNDSLLDILDNFSNTNIGIKVDAIGKANNYIYWGSEFDKVLETAEHIKQRGHKVSFVSKVSIYNIAVLNELLEFFNDSGVSLEIEEGILSPYNFTDKKQIINVLDKCKETNIYKNNETIKKVIDGIYKIYYVSHYQRYNSKQSIEQLELFFKYTDSLDESRGSKLKDYIPELDAIRRVK